MVSVIIPVYNVENYLAACLDSVLQQTYRDLEILLINDGSTDRSGEICLTYAAQDERIRYFKTENRGLSEARNLGLCSCTGEYISFVDSDDRLHPQAIEFMLRAIRENDVPLVKAGFDRIPDGGNPPFTRLEYEKLSVVVQDCETEIRNSFERELLRSIWSGLYSKSSLDGFHFESCQFNELNIVDIPEIILKDRDNIMQFNLLKGYANVLIGSDKLIEYIMCNLDRLHQFEDKIFFDIDGFGSVVFDGIYIMWNRRFD